MSDRNAIDRRTALAGLAALPLAGCGGSGGSPPVSSMPAPSATGSAPPSPGLDALAMRKGRRFGSAIASTPGTTDIFRQQPTY